MTKNKIKKTNKNIANNSGSQINPSATRSQIEIYQNKDNKTEIEVQFDNETFWMNQKQIAEVFGTKIPAINKHINNIINEGEFKGTPGNEHYRLLSYFSSLFNTCNFER